MSHETEDISKKHINEMDNAALELHIRAVALISKLFSVIGVSSILCMLVFPHFLVLLFLGGLTVFCARLSSYLEFGSTYAKELLEKRLKRR